MEYLKLLSQKISDTEEHVTAIEPIRISGRKTILGYRLAKRRIVDRNGYSFDYGYIGQAKDVYLPKKTLSVDWQVARQLLGIID